MTCLAGHGPTPDAAAKSNCEWQLRDKQANNTRRNVWCTLHGITRTLTQWTRLLPVNRAVINYYYNVRKLSIEKAIRKAWTADRCLHWLDTDPKRILRVAAYARRHQGVSIRDAALAVICEEHRDLQRK